VPIELLTLVFFGLLLVFLLAGVPLVFVLGGVSVMFLYFKMGSVGFYIVASKFWDSMTSFTLVAIPMFVYMAMLLERSGVARTSTRVRRTKAVPMMERSTSTPMTRIRAEPRRFFRWNIRVCPPFGGSRAAAGSLESRREPAIPGSPASRTRAGRPTSW